MDILIPDSWLKDYLKTSATPQKLAEYLSLSGPSVDQVIKHEKDFVYSIEVTTNRVDAASVYGIAREAAAILPRFNLTAKLQPVKVVSNQPLVKKVNWLDAKVNHKLCYRFAAVLIRGVQIKNSPSKIRHRLEMAGFRAINNVVDLSNYLMHELGQPVHTFDYDKILGAKMTLRASKKGEKLTTLDRKTHELQGGDIVIEDGKGRLIDLAGIMGAKNSEVDEKTKNVLLFVQTYNPLNIRRTSMALNQRTEAAALFEKGLDPELVEPTIRRGIDLFEELTGGKPEKEILDIYPNPYDTKHVKVSRQFINDRLGIELSKTEISDTLEALGFKTTWLGSQGETLQAQIPSWRANDIEIPEDAIEEIARIYGYHNLPSELMGGKIPDPPKDSPFAFEQKIKQMLQGWGGIEVYTSSLVSKERAALGYQPSWVLKLKNPLGKDSKYLRLSLAPSLGAAVEQNAGINESFHLFEMANVYLPVRGQLPEEKTVLAGLFVNYEFRQAKGILEALLENLHIDFQLQVEEARGFRAHTRLVAKDKAKLLGQLGILNAGYFYYEFDVEALRLAASPVVTYQPAAKYPPQIEDITFILPPRTHAGKVIDAIKQAHKQVAAVVLVDMYENSITLRVAYQDPAKTLTDKEVEKTRNAILRQVCKKLRVRVKG